MKQNLTIPEDLHPCWTWNVFLEHFS